MSPVREELIDGQIALVTLDFPPVNALAPDAFLDITAVFDSFLARPEVRVCVLTAEGERAFCAGVDVRSRLPDGETQASPGAHYRRARETFNSIYESAIPVIGAINGPALGAGLAIAASCDYLLASDRASFGLPEIDVGLLGGARHLQRLFPQGVTRRMHYTAERASAEESLRLGVVHAVVPPGELVEAALAEARVIASKMPTGIRLAKETLNQIEWMDLNPGYLYEQTRTEILQHTEDAAEAKRAFLERRPPRFTGR
jgi:enoyl-CoA hydratase